MLQVFPSSLANWLCCLYGEAYKKDEASCSKSDHHSHICFIGEKTQRDCHLDRYNKYEFMILVEHLDEVTSPLLMKAVTSNSFKVSASVEVFVGERALGNWGALVF